MRLLLFLINFFNIADIITTLYGLNHSSQIVESNPFISFLIAQSPLLFILTKTCLILLITVLLYYIYQIFIPQITKHKKIFKTVALTCTSLCVLIGLFVTLNNIIIITTV